MLDSDGLGVGLCRYTHFLYSGKCSFHNQTTFTNNSHIPSHRKFFHVKPSERYHPAKVFVRSDGD